MYHFAYRILNVLVCVIKFLLSFLPFCSLLDGYTNAVIGAYDVIPTKHSNIQGLKIDTTY